MISGCKLEYKPFGLYADRFMELLQDWFATLYKRVSQQYWNNGVYCSVRRGYYMCSFDNAVAEYYIPTALNGENIMQFHRVAVSVLPEVDGELYDCEVRRLIKPFTSPAGIIDSVSIFVVAPKVTLMHALRVKRLKLKAMLKIKRLNGAFIIPIVSPIPEVAFKKLAEHIVNFWSRRVQAFLSKLKIQPWQYEYKIENILSITPNYFSRVIEKYNRQIIHVLRSMVAHLLYFRRMLSEALKSIGELNMMKAKISRLAEIIHVLEPRDRGELIAKIEECIAAHTPRLKQLNNYRFKGG